MIIKGYRERAKLLGHEIGASAANQATGSNHQIDQLTETNGRGRSPILRPLARRLRLTLDPNDRRDGHDLNDRRDGRDRHGKRFLTNDNEETLTLS
jgi:hypothetical protein